MVDDNGGVREGLLLLAESVGFSAQAYATAEAFLEDYNVSQPGCLVLDVRMPGMGGLKLLEQMASSYHLPIIILSGHGDVPMTARAFKAGAVDFVEKPFHQQTLLECIRDAIRQDQQVRHRRSQVSEVTSRLATLTPREREILDWVVVSETTKSIAARLGLSPKTVDFHRVRIMQKMNATGAVDLVRMVLLVQGN